MNKLDLIAERVEEIMRILDLDITPSNEKTPYRIAKMYLNELFVNRGEDLTSLDSQITLFENSTNSHTPIRMRGIKFNSMCEHHWLPFMGEVEVTYTPQEQIIGLSKIPRVVKYFSLRPQLQERLTQEIGEYLVSKIKPLNLSVRIVAEHTCVSVRGIEATGETETLFTYKKVIVNET